MLDGALFCLDVGGGTQDLLLWDPRREVENAVKMVLPAPAQIIARRIRRHTIEGHDIFLAGRLMGGGPIAWSVRRHLESGLKAYSLPDAALTLHDNLERVRSWGVEITNAPPEGAVPVVLGDVDTDDWLRIFRHFEIPFPRHFAVAVQDHGFSPHASNRRFRFEHWENFLAQGGRMADLAYVEPPVYLTRMQAVAKVLPGSLLMDTCAAGVRGALLDPEAQKRQASGLTVVNCGNAHTFAALVREERIQGIYEHHTGLLTPSKFADHLRRFQAGELTNEEVFADEGHGCAYAPDYQPADPFTFTVVTGPRRRLAREWPAVFAAPLGDVMLTGCFGLARAYAEKFQVPVKIGESG